MPADLSLSLGAWHPELALSVGAMATLLCGVFIRRPFVPKLVAWLSLLWAAVGLHAATSPAAPFFGLITLDAISLVFRWIALGVVAIVALMVGSSRDVDSQWTAEYLSLLLLLGVGLMLMAEANHLLMAYLAMELVSLSSYVLVGLARDIRSSEASLKYILFGALSSGIMLFGMSLLYGLTQDLSFSGIATAIAGLPPSALGAVGMAAALMLAGVAYKISMVPFHMWTPDVYEGAPIPVTALLSVGPKAAGLALLLRLSGLFGPIWGPMSTALLVLTAITMTLGNLVALAQTNVKRLLAYSTIGQVGYILIGITVKSSAGTAAILIYLIAYLFMNLGAFACVVAVWNQTRDESLEAFRGLARRAPALAFCLTVFLLSLAGIPPLVGFLGKFFLFGSAIEAQRTGLAIAGILNSAIALYYYVNIVRLMYLHPSSTTEPVRAPLSLRLAVGVCAAGTILLGIFPSGLLAWIASVV